MTQGVATPVKSTIVRANRTLALRRFTFRVLQELVPAVAERWAALQFVTPQRLRPQPHPTLDGAFTVVAGAYRLQAWSWGVGPPVLLVHGWEGHAGQLRGFVAPLIARGLRVVAFDLPAHGHSSGRRATVLDLAAAVRAVADAVGPLRGVIAHSLGGTATALALHPAPQAAAADLDGSQGLRVHRVVLLAPAAEPTHFVQAMATQLGLSPERTAGMLRRVRKLVGTNFADLSVPQFAGRMTMPLLLVHDPADRLVPWEHGQAIAAAWPGARLRPAPRLGHRRLLADPQVIAEAVAFVCDP